MNGHAIIDYMNLITMWILSRINGRKINWRRLADLHHDKQ